MRRPDRAVLSWRRTIGVLAALAFVLALVTPFTPSSADTVPPAGTPATVSADALPTVQIDGIIWAQAIRGTTVYAVGKFTTVRSAPGATPSSAKRANILAYNIATGGFYPSFDHSLGGRDDAAGRAVAVSPDGTRLYVGGVFSTVDGQPHRNFAAFDLTAPGTPVLGKFSGPDDKVLAVAATNAGVYIGGVFQDAGGSTLVNAYDRDGDPKPNWDVGVTSTAPGAHVAALTVAADNLIIGGTFDHLSSNGAAPETRNSIGAVTLDTGAIVTPWASSDSTYPIPVQPPPGARADALGITTLRTDPDGSKVYLGAFNFITGIPHPGSFEGTAAIDPTDGHVLMINDCAGDTHDVFPVGSVLYSVSHAHNCAPISGYPQLPDNYQHALAETTYVTGVNGPGMGGNYGDFQGQPRGSLLNWFPRFDTGTASGGANDAGWSVVGNADYIAIGGEFKHVNGGAQQGLVRFAVKTKAPNKVGPSTYPGTYGVTAYPANSLGQSFVRVFNVSDEDNGMLTYQVFRSGSTRVITTGKLDSRFWWARSFTFTDTHLPPGTSADYRVVVTDPLGNHRTLDAVTAANDSDSRITYRGTWISLQRRSDATPDFYRGIHYTSATGASYSYSFYGRSVRIIGERGPNRGTAAVTIDGVLAGNYDAYQATRGYQQQLFAKYDLGFGRHTVTVRKTGGTLLDLDAIRVTQDTSYDDPSASISYSRSSGWVSHQNSTTLHYGRGVHYTRHNGASATIHFRGTQVALLSPTGRSFGKVRVSIDGRTPVTVSEYRASSTRYQQVVFSRLGLAAGAHTMTITKLSGTYMEIDAVLSR